MLDLETFASEKEQASVNTKHRRIISRLPTESAQAIADGLSGCESRSMQGQFPLAWHHAKDSYIFDDQGNQWIDFTSTIFVTNIGHGNADVINSVKNVLDDPLLHCYAYPHQRRLEYCRSLLEFCGDNFEKVFLLSAGTEATEAALKLMRLNGLKVNKRKPGVICIEGNWHGRTMGAQLMSSNQDQKQWIGFKDPNIYHLPFPYPWLCDESSGADFFHKSICELESNGVNLSTDICGVMLETFQGWAAAFYPVSYVQAFRQFCDDNGALLTFDEMQSGFGRTGMNFGYEHYDVEADLLCLGKGMASGFPLSGVVGKASVMDLPGVGEMSSTHSANPVSCAAGLATIRYMEKNHVVQSAENKGKMLHNRLLEIQSIFPNYITSIQGKGMIASILFHDADGGLSASEVASKVAYDCWLNGLLVVHTGRESIKIGPPLTIPEDVLCEGLDVIYNSLERLT